MLIEVVIDKRNKHNDPYIKDAAICNDTLQTPSRSLNEGPIATNRKVINSQLCT